MSKLLKQDRKLDVVRVEYRRRTAKKSTARPEPQSDSLLLLTYQPLPEPVAVPDDPTPPMTQVIQLPAPPRLRQPWLRLPAVRWALTGIAAFWALAVVIPHTRRPAAATVPENRVAMIAGSGVNPILPESPGSSAPEASPSVQGPGDAERRLQAMDQALTDTQRVMALMDQAIRQAARAYASTPGPSHHTDSSRADTRS